MNRLTPPTFSCLELIKGKIFKHLVEVQTYFKYGDDIYFKYGVDPPAHGS